ncbi:hypothetical protein Mal64_24120 [Pseudobythopirellula maris]|uniref:Uncharacterized protein n=1 Tax=Pseudobythopirellula maris TaxID=2527991 RepID=A0A5C5ZN60_9BACT|nr:hypothetical protein [Pseudobythopirellula maris]TWT88922.1 hypothetical protein Mal64_24120 [Pseudobythopirellula maris]
MNIRQQKNATRFAATALLIALSAPFAASAEEWSLTTDSGLVARGELDDRTDAARLWLRRESEGIVIATSYSWDEVTRLSRDGQAVDLDGVRGDAAAHATEGPKSVYELPAGDSPPAAAARSHKTYYRASDRPVGAEIVAVRLVNLDRDVEPDGYEVGVALRGSRGLPVAERGSLRASLRARVRRLGEQRWRWRDVESWSLNFAAADWSPCDGGGVAWFRLPWRRGSHDRDASLPSVGLLSVDLGLWGEGSFAASSAAPLRSIGPLRDLLEQETGDRYGRWETTGPRPARRAGDSRFHASGWGAGGWGAAWAPGVTPIAAF